MAKFFALIWKGAILFKRHWIVNVLSILVPCLLFVALAWIHVESGANEARPAKFFEPKDLQKAFKNMAKESKNSTHVLLYTNVSTLADDLMQKVNDSFNFIMSKQPEPVLIDLDKLGLILSTTK
jgi:hypothetical protein